MKNTAPQLDSNASGQPPTSAPANDVNLRFGPPARDKHPMDLDSLGEVRLRVGPNAAVFAGLGVVGLLTGAYLVMSILWGIDAADTLKVIIAALITAACVFLAWAESRSLLVLSERGVFRRTFLKAVTLPFEQVRSVEVLRVGSDDAWVKDLSTGEAPRSTALTISDDVNSVELTHGELEALSKQLSEQVTSRLLAQLEETGAAPLVPGLGLREGKLVGTLAPEATEAPPNTAPPATRPKPQRLELDCDDSRCSIRVQHGWAYLFREEELLAVMAVSARNFFPMMAVLRQVSSWNLG